MFCVALFDQLVGSCQERFGGISLRPSSGKPMSQYAHGPTRRAAQTSSGRSRTRPTDYRGGRRRSGRPVALGVTAPMGEMMDRFAATLLAMLVTAPASAQVMVDGPHLQETCSNPDEVRRAACAGFIGATVDALAPLHEFCIPPVTPPRDHRTHRRFLAQ